MAQSEFLELIFKNCGNCGFAVLQLKVGALNIKYGSNGVGKTTMARALKLQVRGEPLQTLMPFGERSKEADARAQPSCEGCGSLKSILVFDEDYVRQFVFAPSELVQDSFDIFVRTADYDARMAEIDSHLKHVKQMFEDDKKLAQILADLDELGASFGKSASGIAKSGKLFKAIGSGNKIENIPEPLKAYSPFLTSPSKVKWIKWQIDGNNYSGIADDGCPYCVSPINERKEMIGGVAKEYDAKSVEHLVALSAVLERLGDYFADETCAKLAKILCNKTTLNDEETNFLIEIRNQVETLHGKLGQLRTISFFSLRDVDDLEKAVKNLKIDLPLLSHLASKVSTAIVDNLNAKTDSILKEIGFLKGAVAKHHSAIKKTVQRHSTDINTFLQKAGYPYVVEIVPEGDSYKLRLRHADHHEHIQGGSEHLSFGERNALSLVLFMYECLWRKPDVLILDDPISSFDKNKKFAVMDMLFRGSQSLQGMTALMLTHDIEPVIDAGKTLRHTFNPTPQISFLCSRGGQVREVPIEPSDLQTFAQICKTNIAGDANEVVKAIYLRRHYEILDEHGVPYHLLSSLLKEKVDPVIRSGRSEIKMTQAEIDKAVMNIKAIDPAFDYAAILAILTDKARLKETYQSAKAGYDKLQLFRCLVPDPGENVLGKHVKETYHIENDHIVQLNPRKFDGVPEHILEECDALVKQIL